MTSTTTKTASFRSQRTEHQEVKMEIKRSSYGSHDMQVISQQDHASMTESRRWHSGQNRGNNYSSFNQLSFASKMIGGGKAITEGWRVIGDPTMSADRDDESSVVVVQKEKPAFVTPEWMEERPSPEAKRRNPDVLDINILLKYPSGDLPKKNSPDPRKMQYESTIRPEVAKRDNSTPMLLDEDFEDDDDDEFEEVIVIVDVQRNPLWRKGLAKPKPERPKFGVAIHNLLELPTRRTKQESAPDELFTDEKIESVQRPPMNYEAMDLQSILENF